MHPCSFSEAIVFWCEDMPLVVIIDSNGNNLYETGKAEYLKMKEEKNVQNKTFRKSKN